MNAVVGEPRREQLFQMVVQVIAEFWRLERGTTIDTEQVFVIGFVLRQSFVVLRRAKRGAYLVKHEQLFRGIHREYARLPQGLRAKRAVSEASQQHLH